MVAVRSSLGERFRILSACNIRSRVAKTDLVNISKHVMGIADVARFLGVSTERVRQLDDELQPERVQAGTYRHRRYDPAVVARVAKRRSAVGGAR